MVYVSQFQETFKSINTEGTFLVERYDIFHMVVVDSLRMTCGVKGKFESLDLGQLNVQLLVHTAARLVAAAAHSTAVLVLASSVPNFTLASTECHFVAGVSSFSIKLVPNGRQDDARALQAPIALKIARARSIFRR